MAAKAHDGAPPTRANDPVLGASIKVAFAVGPVGIASTRPNADVGRPFPATENCRGGTTERIAPRTNTGVLAGLASLWTGWAAPSAKDPVGSYSGSDAEDTGESRVLRRDRGRAAGRR